jgi:hypothetical protein
VTGGLTLSLQIEGLQGIIKKEGPRVWDRIANLHRERTGRAFHPLDIRDKFLGQVFTGEVLVSSIIQGSV